MAREILKIDTSLAGELWQHAGPTVRPGHPHTHAELEFNLVTRGTAVYLLNDRRYELGPRSLVWLFPAQPHMLVDAEACFEMWIIVLRARELRSLCRGPKYHILRSQDPPGSFCRTLDAPSFGELHRLMLQARRAREDAVLYNAALRFLLLQAWAQFDSAEDAAWWHYHPAVERAARYLREDHLQAHLVDLADLAKRVGLSATHLSRLFKQEMGVGVSEFRNRLRLEEFLYLAQGAEDQSLLSLAMSAGFGSYAQFHRVFRRHLGRSPDQWRREQATTEN